MRCPGTNVTSLSRRRPERPVAAVPSVRRGEEIAEALGTDAVELRRWLGDNAPKHPAHTPPPILFPAAPPHPPGATGVLMAAVGSAKTNDFAREVAAIRTALAPLGDDVVVERFNVEIAEISPGLGAHRPAMLHIAAHSDMGCVFLCLDGAASAVEHFHLHRAMRDAPARPALVVLNFCDSQHLAHALVVPDALRSRTLDAAIGWRGTVTDEQARIFATQLYARLSRGDNAQASFDLADLTVTTTWPDQAEPCLNGDGSTIPFPRNGHR
jgi:hypothetical protein